MINAGKYNKKITIYEIRKGRANQGFPIEHEERILTCYANVKTTKGFTLIVNNSDFEKALTNFTIRYSKEVVDAYKGPEEHDYERNHSNRDLLIKFNNKVYTVEYLNNVNENNIELEMQSKEVMK
jgi:hypothetical protein